MSSIKKIVPELSAQLNIKCEKSRTIAYGVYKGYTIFIWGDIYSSTQRIRVSFCVCSNGVPVDSLLVQSALTDDAGNINERRDKYILNLSFTLNDDNDRNVNWMMNTTRNLVQTLSDAGCVNCDEEGVVGPTSVYKLTGRFGFLSETTAVAVRADIEKTIYDASLPKENYGAGISNALLCALTGSMLALMMGRLGFISTFTSAALGFIIVFYYQKYAGKLSHISASLCMLISTLSTYVVFWLDASLDLFLTLKKRSSSVHATITDCLIHTKELYDFTNGNSMYSRNLMLMVLAGTLGTLFTICLFYNVQNDDLEMRKLE